MNRRFRSGGRLALLAITFANACSNPTGACETADGIVGQWSYRATQESPARGAVSGTLVIASRNCVDFQGVMDVVETLATGESSRLAGPVSGTVVDAKLVHFEASLGADTREHLARLQGDSLAGSWVESSGTIPSSGQFGGRRQVVQ
jgi:hypothetical protein